MRPAVFHYYLRGNALFWRADTFRLRAAEFAKSWGAEQRSQLGAPAEGMAASCVQAHLACDGRRSKLDPDLEAAGAAAMHPVTGAFGEPSHESTFASSFFRSPFPVHVLLMATCLAIYGGAAIYGGLPNVWASWLTVALCLALGLAGRLLIHRMHDVESAQRLGAWTWVVMLTIAKSAGQFSYTLDPIAAAQENSVVAVTALAIGLVNGMHGLAFVPKVALLGLVVLMDLVELAICGGAALPLTTHAVGALIVGAAIAQVAELHLRHIYAERVQERRTVAEEKLILEERLQKEKRWLEVRTEQLQAEKERLLYDVQRRGRPLDDDDERSAIRRGLQAGSSRPYRSADDPGSSETGAPAPSESPPPSLPPGAPSSTSSGSIDSMTTMASCEAAGGAPAQADVLLPSLPPRAPSSTAIIDKRIDNAIESRSGRHSRSAEVPFRASEIGREMRRAERAARSTNGKAAAAVPLVSAEPYVLSNRQRRTERPARSSTGKRAAPFLAPAEADRHRRAERPGRSPFLLDVAPLTWEEADRQFYAERALAAEASNVAALAAPSALSAAEMRSEQVRGFHQELAAAEVLVDIAGVVSREGGRAACWGTP